MNLDALENKKKSKKSLETAESDEENMTNAKAKKKSKKSAKNTDTVNLDESNGVASDHDEVDHSIDNDIMSNDVCEVEIADETENDAKHALLKSCTSSGEIYLRDRILNVFRHRIPPPFLCNPHRMIS